MSERITEDATVLFARMEAAKPVDAPKPKRPLAETSLQHMKLFDNRTIQRLTEARILTAADFLAMPAETLMPSCSAAKVKRWQRAVRFAHSVDRMQPWHALLLFAIHRRSPNKLAAESIGTLHRDIARFAWSSAGQKMMRKRSLPSHARVECWVHSARQRQERKRLRRRAAA